MDISPSALMDPKSMKKQMTNGIPMISKPSTVIRAASEEPSFATSSKAYSTFDLSFPLHPKDDAYNLFEGKDKRLPGQQPGQAPSNLASVRQLLDPKGFNKTNSSTSPHSRSPHLTQNFRPLHQQTNEHQSPSPTPEPHGIGNFIEQLHGVSQREARPVKRQKRDEEEPNRTKAAFVGGKGGELGEYVKEKRKEGLKESGPLDAIVDLTEGLVSR